MKRILNDSSYSAQMGRDALIELGEDFSITGSNSGYYSHNVTVALEGLLDFNERESYQAWSVLDSLRMSSFKSITFLARNVMKVENSRFSAIFTSLRDDLDVGKFFEGEFCSVPFSLTGNGEASRGYLIYFSKIPTRREEEGEEG